MLNLLTNAIKFQAAGKILVKHSITPNILSENQVSINVAVIDQGIGMSQREIENVFKLSWRSGSVQSRNLNYHGNGLGLWICEKICKGLSGGIRVQSGQDVGTTFDFTIAAYKNHPDS